MSRNAVIASIVSVFVIAASYQQVGAIVYVAPGINVDGSGSGPYVRGPFSVGNFTNPAGLGLPLQPFYSVHSAFNVGPVGTGATTIGGVSFAASSGQFGPNLGGWGAPTFSDPGLNTVGATYMVAFANNTRSTTISGLTVGKSYRTQLIIWDGDASDVNATYRGTTAVTVGSDTLTNFNDWSALGLPAGSPFQTAKGSFINYTFVATGTTLLVSVTADASSAFVMQAFDLVQLPEPASASILLLAGAATMSRTLVRRRTATRVAWCVYGS
jgi:hypothetical protein